MTRSIPKVLNNDQTEAFLSKFNQRYYCPHRNWLLCRLMLNCGLRVSEICDLKTNHLDVETGKLDVKDGKGGKDRILWVSEGYLEDLNRFRDRRPYSERLFSTSKGTRLSRQYLWEMVKRVSSQAGIGDWPSPHTLRHTFATNLLQETGNIRLVQKALGHASIETTQIYAHIVDEELEDALKSMTC